MNVAFFLTVLVAVAVEATAGFGSTIITVALASQWMAVDEVLAAFVPLSVVLASWIVWNNLPYVDTALLSRRVAPWMGLGFAAGLSLVDVLGQTWLKFGFGLFVLVLAAVELRRGTIREPSPALARVALVGAGLVHGLFACGGPLLVWVVGGELPDKARFRATLAAVWVVLGLLLVGRYAWAGRLDLHSLRTSAALLPALFLGKWLGDQAHTHVAPTTFRRGVFVLLGLAGAALSLRALA